MARVTLQTIADRVGVSRMTVSNAFSRPDQLSAELRLRILEAATALGYVGPDPAARALARGTTGAVGVLLTSSLRAAFTDEVATGFLGAVTDELGPTGLAVTLLPAVSTGGVVPARDAALDGAIVYSCEADTAAIDWLVRRPLPLVLVDQDPVPGTPCVNVDDRAGSAAAARHLLDLGHRRIAVLTAYLGDDLRPGLDAEQVLADPAIRHVPRERLLGWRDTLAAEGVRPAVHRQRHSDDEEARLTALRLLRGPERPTGVLCFSDLIAYGVVRAAEELGLRVPEDVSVVGFDDSPLARRLRPTLTTVRQDVAEKGRLAAAYLRTALTPTAAVADPEHVLLPTELVVRDSTAPPRARRL